MAYGQRAQTALETDLLEGMGSQVRDLNGIPVPLGEQLADAAAVMVTVQEITEPVLATMPACKIIARVGTGLDSIDLEAAAQHGILVTNVADYSVDEVSTDGITLLLTCAPAAAAGPGPGPGGQVGLDRWRDHPQAPRPDPRPGGFGRIGQAPAAKALGLGLRVLVCDPFKPAADIEAAGAEAADQVTLLREPDGLLEAPRGRDDVTG